jgi:hypothetical protein
MRAPNNSTFTIFREWLLKRSKLKVFEKLVQIALQRNIQMDSIQIVDSVLSKTIVYTNKDQKHQSRERIHNIQMPEKT